MKNNKNKSEHTQGKWEIGSVSPCTITVNHTVIAKTFVAPQFKTATREQAEANARRIVKAVNILSEIEQYVEGHSQVIKKDLLKKGKIKLEYLSELLEHAEHE